MSQRQTPIIDAGHFAIRTERYMTITEAHPFHGMTAAGREFLDRGGSTAVWKEHDPTCPLCRREAEDRERAGELFDETRAATFVQAADPEEESLS